MYIPDLHLGVEFQDAHHYTTAWYAHDSLDNIQLRDIALIRKHGIELILVPYWWNSDAESLMDTINFQAPWILDKTGDNPIPLNPIPTSQGEGVVPEGVGELMLATFVDSFPSHFSRHNPIQKWWLGEKYDGIRYVWSPYSKTLYSRNGNALKLPSSHSSWLSSFSSFLDGEIWFGRGNYLETQALLSSLPQSQWHSLRMLIFDVPISLNIPYEERYDQFLFQLSSDHPFANNAIRVGIKNERQALAMLKSIIEEGNGEGVILQKKNSIYENGRSPLLLKVKSSRGDTEALVVSVNELHYSLKLPTGQIFEVPINLDLENQPKKGDIVTFEFESASRREIPTNPKITRVRKDVSWADVVRDHSSKQKYDASQQQQQVFTEMPRRYWKIRSGKNMRTFFEDFAKKRNLDPLNPQTWYSLSRKDFAGTPGASFLHSVGYMDILQKLFPEIGLDPKKFPSTPHRFWTNLQNRKQFFDELAKEKGFDPLIPQNWYSFTRKMLQGQKGDPLRKYEGIGGIGKALTHLYPDIGLDINKFPRPMGYWKVASNRKQFFDNFAKESGFNPLFPENWYSIKGEQLEKKGAGSLLKYSRDGYVGELVEVYPDIGLDLHKFNVVPRTYWQKIENRKRVFEEFVKKNTKEPLPSVDFWYSVFPTQLRKEKHASTMLEYYKNDMVAALQDLYPSMHFKPDYFLFSMFIANGVEESEC